MAKNTLSYLFLIISVVNCIHNVNSNEYVPVFVWGSISEHRALPALNKLSKSDFSSTILRYISEGVFTVVFEEETLSLEDLRCEVDGKSCFNFQKTQREDVDPKDKFFFFPAVDSPVSVLHSIPASNDPVILGNLTSNGFKVNKEDGAKMMFVSLEDGIVFNDREQMLAAHDALIAEKYNELVEEFGKVVAIYTGKRVSWQVPDAVRHTRSLLADGDEGEDSSASGISYNSSNTLLYVTEVSVTFSNEEPINVTFSDNEITNITSEFMTLQLKNVDYAFDLTFATAGGYWAISEASFMKLADPVSSYALRFKPINGLTGFSYHCDELIRFSNGNNITVDVSGLQVQPFFGNDSFGGKFGDALDCVGFMSAPILAGIFVTFLFGGIIALGICMLLDLKTMDRFEDPKGKTITVTASE